MLPLPPTQMKAMPSWKKTDYGTDTILAGWRKWVAGSH